MMMMMMMMMSILKKWLMGSLVCRTPLWGATRHGYEIYSRAIVIIEKTGYHVSIQHG